MAIYMITDGNGSYIRHDPASNKYVPVRSRGMASQWTDLTKARNIYQSLQKSVRRTYELKMIETDHPPALVNIPPEPEPSAHTAQLSHLPDISFDSFADLTYIKERVEEVITLLTGANQKAQQLETILSSTDKEIIDLEHYIEFNRLNASDGYVAYKKLRERLLFRRAAKNELRVRQLLAAMQPVNSELSRVHAEILAVTSQQYTPRALEDLFE